MRWRGSVRPITVFCCSVRPMFSVMCGLKLFVVYGCRLFTFLCCFCFYSRHLYFYLFYLFLKGFSYRRYCVQSWDYEYSMHTLNILSLNVNGLNSAVKRTRVLEYFHRKSISCALIQETHLKQSDVARFQNKYYKLIAFSCAQNKTKGVLILLTGS